MRKSYAQVMSASASHSFIIASISGVGLSNHSSACTATSAGWEANTLTAYGTVIVGRGKAGRVLVKCVKLHKLYGGGCGVGGWLSIFQLASERSEYEHKSAHGLDHNKSSIKSWLCLHKKRREKLRPLCAFLKISLALVKKEKKSLRVSRWRARQHGSPSQWAGPISMRSGTTLSSSKRFPSPSTIIRYEWLLSHSPVGQC